MTWHAALFDDEMDRQERAPGPAAARGQQKWQV